MKNTSIGAFVGLGILVFLLVLAIIGVIFARKYLKTSKRQTINSTFGPCITPRQPKEFVIPPYTLLSDGSDGTTTPVSENEDVQTDETVKKISPLVVRRSLSMPAPLPQTRARQAMFSATPGDEGESSSGLSTKAYRPQYRRVVSHYPALSAPTKKVSVAPYGKLEVSIQYVADKKLLFVQVCFSF